MLAPYRTARGGEFPVMADNYDTSGWKPYDVIQVGSPAGKFPTRATRWSDYSTIRDHSDAVYAKRLVDGHRFGGHATGPYRIVRDGRVVHGTGEVSGAQRRRIPHPRSRDQRLVIARELARRRSQARNQERNRRGEFK